MADYHAGPVKTMWESLLSFGSYPEEPEEHRARRRIIVGVGWLFMPYFAFSIVSIGLAPFEGVLVIVVVAAVGLAMLATLLLLRRYPLGYTAIVQIPQAANLVGAVVITVMLGGLYGSGLQMMWVLMGVVYALVAVGVRWALFWFGAFLASLALSLFLSASIEPLYSWPDPEVRAVSTITFTSVALIMGMVYFVRQRDNFQRQSDDLLHNILPDEIVIQLKQDSGMIAEHFDQVSVLFADVVDFTPMSASMTPTELVGLLNEIFSVFDDFVEEMGLEKIKTIGDEYMVAAGVPTPRPDHAHRIADLALRMRDHVADHEFAGHSIRFRTGINSGPVVAGIIGHHKFIYDLWGDTVNTASRMESHGTTGHIQITSATHQLLEDDFVCERRGTVDVKGKGEVETWYLLERRATQPAGTD